MVGTMENKMREQDKNSILLIKYYLPSSPEFEKHKMELTFSPNIATSQPLNEEIIQNLSAI